MDSFITWTVTAALAFAATNVDDILLLTIFFSQVNDTLRPKHIIIGQYLGLGILIVISLLGYFGTLLIPEEWIGLLGLAPIIIGIKRLVQKESPAADQSMQADLPVSSPHSFLSGFLSPHTYSIAVITFANGGDNIAIYIPLFASGSTARMGVIISVFLMLIAVWCYVGARLAQHPTIAHVLDRYGHIIVPFVLIGIGTLILLESGVLALIGL